MESKTLLLDLVQQRKDGRITQEEMVRQLVELRNQDGATPAVPVATAPTPGGGADQRASIQADIERQREERLAAKQQGGGSAARQAWGGAPAPAPAAPATGRDAAVVAKSYCSAVSAHHRDGRSAFDAYDTSRSGVISFEDLRRGVRSDPSTSRSALTDTDLRQIWTMMDRSHNDSVTAIEFEDFLSDFASSRKQQAPAVSQQTKAAVANLRRKFRAAAYAQGGVHWKNLFDFYDKSNSGALDFEEFARAVRKDGKVTRGAMGDQELHQLFDIVGNSTGSVSAEDFERFLQGGQTKKPTPNKRDTRRQDTSTGWEGTETGSDASYPVGGGYDGQVSSQASFSTDPSFQRGQRVARRLKEEEDAKCTFAPEISGLPEKLYASRDSISDAPIEQRAHQWLEKREQKRSAERRKAEDNETSGCTFHPKISSGTKSRQKQARSGRTREMEFERLYSEKLGRDHASAKKSDLPDAREDGGNWFKPKIYRPPKDAEADNYSKPVVRKVGAVTQQLLNDREGEFTFKPKTNQVSAKFSCASEYLADSAFDRLSRPARTLPGDSSGGGGSSELNSSGERLFDSVYGVGEESTQRTQRARPGTAPRMRAAPTRRDGDAMLPDDLSMSARTEALYEKGQAWAEKKQSKLDQVAQKVLDEERATVVGMSKKTRKLAVERRDGNFLDRVQADATKRETHAYKHAELRSADDNCTFKPTINRSSKELRGRSVDELSRGDAAHNLDLKEELEKQSRMAEHSNYKFKPLLNTDVVTVPGRLQLHTKEGRESYLSRIKEAETDIAQAVEERRTQQERDELNECTFKPEIRDAPQYVKRIANSMKLTRAAKPPPEKTNYSFLSTREH